MKANTLKRLETLEEEQFSRRLREMSDEELIEMFTALDNERRRALGQPLDVTFDSRVREAREVEGL